ncbi:MAG TPA: hypothetical protein VGM50_18055 [Gemmatimonadaceae bacterium]
MDRDVVTFAGVMAILIPSFAAVVATVVFGLRALRPRPKQIALAQDDERMARLEQAVDAIALEMERVGEGQRYLTQLMSQRLPAANAPNSSNDLQRGRVITPH